MRSRDSQGVGLEAAIPERSRNSAMAYSSLPPKMERDSLRKIPQRRGNFEELAFALLFVLTGSGAFRLKPFSVR